MSGSSAPPTFDQFVSWSTQAVPVLPIVAILLASAYLTGALALWVRGRGWSKIRTVCFLLGCTVLLLVTGMRIEDYGLRMFSVFIFQQLTLMMIIPPLLVVGSPGTLLLRAVPHRCVGARILRIALWGLRSRAGRWALHPALVTPLLALSLFGLYLGGAANLLLRSPVGHVALEALFLVVGILLATPLVSTDPLPRRTSFVARLFDTFAEMQLHAIFGLVFIFAATPLIPFFASPPGNWGLDPIRDQAMAGAIVWTYGELPAIAILVVTLARWERRDSVRAARDSKRKDQDGDKELENYNAYLQSLQRR